MNKARVLFVASLFAGVAGAIAAGCGSSSKPSSTNTGSGEDSGGEAAAPTGVLGSGCSPLSGGAMCNPGLSCSVNLSGGITALAGAIGGGSIGTCVQPSSCDGGICIECMTPSDCPTAQPVCCGGFGGDAGGLAALAEAGLGDSGISLDAAITADSSAGLLSGLSGLSGLTGALSGLSITSTCQTSCTATQEQLCSTNSDCKGAPNGATVCTMISLATLGGGAAGGEDAGALGSELSSFLPPTMACINPDAGIGLPIPDASSASPDASSGSTDGGSSSSDAGSGDAGAPTDGATSG